MDIIGQIETIGYTTHIQKFGASTGLADSKALKGYLLTKYTEVPSNLANLIVWRCKIGRATKWFYGETFEEATTEAIENFKIQLKHRKTRF